MIKKTKIELEKDKITKITRTIIRLKHSLAADEEINEVLSERLDRFDKALQNGELLELTIPEDLTSVNS